MMSEIYQVLSIRLCLGYSPEVSVLSDNPPSNYKCDPIKKYIFLYVLIARRRILMTSSPAIGRLFFI